MVLMAGRQQASIRLPVAQRADAGRPGRYAGVPQADPELCYEDSGTAERAELFERVNVRCGLLNMTAFHRH